MEKASFFVAIRHRNAREVGPVFSNFPLEIAFLDFRNGCSRRNQTEKIMQRLILWKPTCPVETHLVGGRVTSHMGSGNCKGVRHEATLRWSCAMKMKLVSAIELVAGKVDLVGID